MKKEKRLEVDKSDPLYQEIFRLPKTDLHCHLDGSLRIDTIVELIKEQGMPYPVSREELSKLLVKDNLVYAKNKSLPEYLKAFEITTSVMQNEASLERIAFEVAEDAAQENVRYLEVRFAPILHTNKGLDMESITSAVCRGLARAEGKYDMVTGIIICAMRHYVSCGIEDNLMKSLPYATHDSASVLMAVETAMHAVEMAKKDHHIVGFDLAGAEMDNPPKRYKKAFSIVTNGYIPITVHAGEAFGPESIQQAVTCNNVKRIGHGTNLYKDPLLMSYFMNERIPIEVCLTSNLQTNPEHNTYESHPLRIYLENRLRTTLCTDNRLVSDTTVTKELYIAAKAFSLDLNHIKILITHGFNSALYNCYYPEALNSYNSMRNLRSRVARELKYKDALEEVNKAYVKSEGE
ncbi:MAG: adenosine deaminase family protein [Candidatus Eremiobacteraeota bacterium]|nr:adenosine deaminase family protein [Candidatus Eremiobacteraeota bacterium]